eukprot:TRINITY_DN24080_c0_g1_i1.p1 TRINITY_DN24080_c0_g1~~TRINITY_DN24080_c0_g1_i1.p1  ORF type:complete len:960 (-),score=137.21 TRINITY_DN24080_c0_g1_i1:495-3374(-)
MTAPSPADGWAGPQVGQMIGKSGAWVVPKIGQANSLPSAPPLCKNGGGAPLGPPPLILSGAPITLDNVGVGLVGSTVSAPDMSSTEPLLTPALGSVAPAGLEGGEIAATLLPPDLGCASSLAACLAGSVCASTLGIGPGTAPSLGGLTNFALPSGSLPNGLLCGTGQDGQVSGGDSTSSTVAVGALVKGGVLGGPAPSNVVPPANLMPVGPLLQTRTSLQGPLAPRVVNPPPAISGLLRPAAVTVTNAIAGAKFPPLVRGLTQSATAGSPSLGAFVQQLGASQLPRLVQQTGPSAATGVAGATSPRGPALIPNISPPLGFGGQQPLGSSAPVVSSALPKATNAPVGVGSVQPEQRGEIRQDRDRIGQMQQGQAQPSAPSSANMTQSQPPLHGAAAASGARPPPHAQAGGPRPPPYDAAAYAGYNWGPGYGFGGPCPSPYGSPCGPPPHFGGPPVGPHGYGGPPPGSHGWGGPQGSPRFDVPPSVIRRSLADGIDGVLNEIRHVTSPYAQHHGCAPCLDMLDLCACSLDDPGAQKLFEVLMRLKVSCRRLMLSGNSIGDLAVTALSGYLWHSPEPLWELALADNAITDTGVEDLLRCLYNHPGHPPRLPGPTAIPGTGAGFPLRIDVRNNVMEDPDSLLKRVESAGGEGTVQLCVTVGDGPAPPPSEANRPLPYLWVFLPRFREQRAAAAPVVASVLPTSAPTSTTQRGERRERQSRKDKDRDKEIKEGDRDRAPREGKEKSTREGKDAIKKSKDKLSHEQKERGKEKEKTKDSEREKGKDSDGAREKDKDKAKRKPKKEKTGSRSEEAVKTSKAEKDKQTRGSKRRASRSTSHGKSRGGGGGEGTRRGQHRKQGRRHGARSASRSGSSSSSRSLGSKSQSRSQCVGRGSSRVDRNRDHTRRCSRSRSSSGSSQKSAPRRLRGGGYESGGPSNGASGETAGGVAVRGARDTAVSHSGLRQ